jgi:hypothetical protein
MPVSRVAESDNSESSATSLPVSFDGATSRVSPSAFVAVSAVSDVMPGYLIDDYRRLPLQSADIESPTSVSTHGEVVNMLKR